MKPIAIFYHCFLFNGNPPTLRQRALDVVLEQMGQLEDSGLIGNVSQFIIGINGGVESYLVGRDLFPPGVEYALHGLQCKSETRTILEIEKWLPNHQDWYVLYFHCKTASREQDDAYRQQSVRWMRCLMLHLITNWELCIKSLDMGCDTVGCHWLQQQCDGTQKFWAGNFWWAKSNYLLTLPSIQIRPQIRIYGLDDLSSRYEAEIWIGNGPRFPVVRDYHPGHPNDSH